jgi:hypothetical protein
MESEIGGQTWLPTRDLMVLNRWSLARSRATSVRSGIFEHPFTAPGTVRVFAALPYVNFSRAKVASMFFVLDRFLNR